MKFSILALSALLAFAAAADTTTVNPSTITTTPEAECAKSCEVRDICCTAKCYNVPCPSENQANDTNDCVSACPQGTGSPADAQKYADCEQSCLNSHFWGGSGATATHSSTTSSSTTSTGTGSTATQISSDSSSPDASSSGTNDSNDNTSDNTSDDSSSSSTTTSSSGFSQQTTNAGANVKLGASAAGLLGLVVAAFAL